MNAKIITKTKQHGSNKSVRVTLQFVEGVWHYTGKVSKYATKRIVRGLGYGGSVRHNED